MDPKKNSPNKKNGDNKKNKNLKGFLTLVAWALVLTVALNFLSAYAGNRSNKSTSHEVDYSQLWTLVEQGKIDTEETRQLLQKILSPYIGQLDAIVLGCTHYPFVAKTVSQVLGAQVQVLDGGAGTARQTKRLLEEKGWLHYGEGSLKMENSSLDPRLLERGMELLDR